MKKIISILLVLLLCVSIFVACDDISGNNNNGGSENGGSGSGNGESGGGSGSGSGSGNGGTEGASGNGGTENGSGTGNGGTENGSGNGNTGNGGNENTTKGEAITQEQWDNIRTNSPTNYSYIRNMIRNGEEIEEILLMDGREYMRILKTKEGEEKLLGILEDDRIINYEFDYSKGTWGYANHGISYPYPLASFPYDFSQLVFNTETGSYSLTVTQGNESVTMSFLFKDSNCVYFGYEGFDVELYDYGTTVVPRPEPFSDEGGNGMANDGSGGFDDN